MADKRWTEEQTCKFVEKYVQLECLWKVEHELYKNKDARQAALTELARIVEIEGFRVPKAKNKIRSLRATYYGEINKIQRSAISGVGDLYKPSMRWFYIMEPIMSMRRNNIRSEPEMEKAIQEEENIPSTSSTQQTQLVMELEKDIQEEEYTPSTSSTQPTQFLMDSPNESNEVDEDAIKEETSSTHSAQPSLTVRKLSTLTSANRKSSRKTLKTKKNPQKRRKTKVTDVSHAENEPTSLIEPANNECDNTDQECDIFGKYVAVQLKQMSLEERIVVQNKINNILSNARLKQFRNRPMGCSSSTLDDQLKMSYSPSPSIQSLNLYALKCSPDLIDNDFAFDSEYNNDNSS